MSYCSVEWRIRGFIKLWEGIEIDQNNIVTITKYLQQPELLCKPTEPYDQQAASFYFYIMGSWPSFYLGERYQNNTQIRKNIITY